MTQPMINQTIARADQMVKSSNRLAKQIDHLTDDILALDPNEYIGHEEEIKDILLIQAQVMSSGSHKLLALTRRFDSLKLKSSAAKLSADDLAEFAADSMLIVQQIEGISNLTYIAWAQHTARLEYSLFDLAIREVLTLSGGRRTIEQLRDAITRGLE